ncbi:MAG: SulP family inorganic anion transporter [Gemmatimonadetes bacterium]|nr:SulP family inorganic anion transporter [Gemmatimonadota bacterium]
MTTRTDPSIRHTESLAIPVDHLDQPAWRQDIPASIVVALVALPLCLGVALASGAPASAGIIAGIVGGLVVGVLSGSELMVSGPAAGLTAIVLAAITQLGGLPAFLAAVVIAGAMQVVLGALRAGVIAYYIPTPVVKGMLAAIGVILVLKQLPHAVGYDADWVGDESFRQADRETTFSAMARALEAVEPLAIVVSVVGLVVLASWNRLPWQQLRQFPAPLVVAVLGVAANALAAVASPAWVLQSRHLVALPVEGGWSALLTWPDWSAFARADVWTVAITLALVASIETLLSLEATDRMDPLKRRSPASRELVAQGAGNLLSGLIGGLPITGVIVRSAANVTAGARTRRSAIMHGAWLLGAVALVPGLLNRIPLAALAAILLHTGLKLAAPGVARNLWRQGTYQFAPFAVTLLAILFTDLLRGVVIGLGVGAFFVLLDHLRAPAWEEVSAAGAVLRRYRLNTHVTFLNKASLARELDAVPRRARIEIDARGTERIDRDALEVLHDFAATAQSREIDYRLVGVPERGASAGGH